MDLDKFIDVLRTGKIGFLTPGLMKPHAELINKTLSFYTRDDLDTK